MRPRRTCLSYGLGLPLFDLVTGPDEDELDDVARRFAAAGCGNVDVFKDAVRTLPGWPFIRASSNPKRPISPGGFWGDRAQLAFDAIIKSARG